MSPVSSSDDENDDGKGTDGAAQHDTTAALSGGLGVELSEPVAVSAAPFVEPCILSSAAAVEC